MTWGAVTAMALLVLWLLYAALRRSGGPREAPPREALTPIDRAYAEQERIERAKAERLMREHEERERRGY